MSNNNFFDTVGTLATLLRSIGLAHVANLLESAATPREAAEAARVAAALAGDYAERCALHCAARPLDAVRQESLRRHERTARIALGLRDAIWEQQARESSAA